MCLEFALHTIRRLWATDDRWIASTCAQCGKVCEGFQGQIDDPQRAGDHAHHAPVEECSAVIRGDYRHDPDNDDGINEQEDYGFKEIPEPLAGTTAGNRARRARRSRGD